MNERNTNPGTPEALTTALPKILVIDDLFGRVQDDGRNPERRDLCGQFLIEDVTGDLQNGQSRQKIKRPIAQAVFCRGQTPAGAGSGDMVENDLYGTLNFVRQLWQPDDGSFPLAMVLLDLCFYTGRVTAASESKRGRGMPEGRDSDDKPALYFGLRVLDALNQEFPNLPVIILSSMPREGVSQQFSWLMGRGFLPRGDANSPKLLRDYLWRHGLIPDQGGRIVGKSKELLLALWAARRAAADRLNVLIRGERGAGKELLAEYINRCGAPEEKRRPLVVVDSGTLTPALYASELFGHVKGAFTGADRERQGRIVQADGGDLFLDEIGNMPPDVQTGLLRVLEGRLVTPLGASSGRAVDVRFISATNEDIELKAAVGEGFRADLLDRLREGRTVVLPPLRERREDIPLLVEQFVRQAEAAGSGAMTRKIAPEAMAKLVAFDWPGNVRELRNCLLKAISDHPDVEHLVPGHLVFAKDSARVSASQLSARRQGAKGVPAGRVGEMKIADLIALLEQVEIDAAETSAWAGRWPDLQRGYADVTLKLLRVALLATRRITLQNPEGELKIHPAIKLLTGDSAITATKAADLVKRIFSSIPEAIRSDFQRDPVLQAAYDIAVRLRPTSAKPGSGKERQTL
jgi:transcriptional regulator with AAA-type ATPase domain